MRRFILSLLLVLLPLQFSWAAAAAYCGHETGAAAQHFGHHDHRHAGAPGEVSKQDTAKQDAAEQDAAKQGASKDSLSKVGNLHDADCGMCHFGCGMLVPNVLKVADVEAQPVRFAEPVEHDSHIPQLPERPDRLRLA